MLMKWTKTEKGTNVLELNKGNYISFRGDEGNIKWLHLSFEDSAGVRKGALIPVTLKKVKGEHTKIIGKKNLQKIKDAIKPNLTGDVLNGEGFKAVYSALDEN